MGVDRGENNLIYVSLIDNNKKVLLQKSLNEIFLGNKKVNFKKLLEQKEILKIKRQRSWDEEVIIKNLKKAYLSFAVKEIIDIAYRENALIIIEDLSQSFFQKRAFIAKNIYQNFEIALAKKLNYLVFKEKLNGQPGSPLFGLQLTSLVNNYKNLSKPIEGILIFVPPNFTSNIDPLTGFHNYFNFDIKNKDYHCKFLNGINFLYDNKKDIFYLDIDSSKLKNFINRKKILPDSFLKKTWRLRSNVKRSNFKDKTEFVITEKIKEFFNDTDYSDIQIKNKLIADLNLTKKFVNEILMKWFSLRYKSKDIDAIISPVSDFDTTKKLDNLPNCADANGAYCIAIKGKVVLDKFLTQGKYNVEIRKEEIEKEFLQLLSSLS